MRSPYTLEDVPTAKFFAEIHEQKSPPDSYLYWNGQLHSTLAQDLGNTDLYFRSDDREKYIDLWLGGVGTCVSQLYAVAR